MTTLRMAHQSRCIFLLLLCSFLFNGRFYMDSCGSSIHLKLESEPVRQGGLDVGRAGHRVRPLLVDLGLFRTSAAVILQ